VRVNVGKVRLNVLPADRRRCLWRARRRNVVTAEALCVSFLPCVFGDSLSQELFVGGRDLNPRPEDYEDFRP
jgi:hypothetical protein